MLRSDYGDEGGLRLSVYKEGRALDTGKHRQEGPRGSRGSATRLRQKNVRRANSERGGDPGTCVCGPHGTPSLWFLLDSTVSETVAIERDAGSVLVPL